MKSCPHHFLVQIQVRSSTQHRVPQLCITYCAPTNARIELQYLRLDGIHATPSEVGQWSGGRRKRKRETSLSQVQQVQLPFGFPAARSLLTLHDEQYYGRPWKSRRNNAISSSDGGEYMPASPQQPIAHHRGSNSEGRNLFWVFLGSFRIRNRPALAVRSTRPSQAVDRERVERRSGFKHFRSYNELAASTTSRSYGKRHSAHAR